MSRYPYGQEFNDPRERKAGKGQDDWQAKTRGDWTQSLRPVLPRLLQNRQVTTVGGSGDISTGSAEQVIWADATDHTKDYGTPAAGAWFWNYNLFSEFSLPGAASFFVAYGGTVQAGTVQMDLELIDSTLAVLTSCSVVVSYSVDLTTIQGFNYSCSLVSYTVGAGVPTVFNAVRVRSTCSNTNLSQLLNYASHGSFPIVSAFIVYPRLTTQVDLLPLIGV